MNHKLIRFNGFLLFIAFTFHQISFANPVSAFQIQPLSIKSDPAFSMKDLKPSDLDQIKQRLTELVTEDIYFGQSAMYS